jgi:hypothetical protein
MITKRSFVFYARPKGIPAEYLTKLYLADKIDAYCIIIPPLLDSIISGAKTSLHFPTEKYACLLD